tara:strand:- start:964 stop:2895 length:1932 start_codon:yes stop_codon:yes gene_type:complete
MIYFYLLLFSISICDDVHFWISSVSEEYIDLSIKSSNPIYGFDFKIFSNESDALNISYIDEEFSNDNTSASIFTINSEQGLIFDNNFNCFTDGQNRFLSLSMNNNFLPATDSTLLMRIPILSNQNMSSYFISEPSFFTKDFAYNIIDLDVEYGLIEYQNGWPYNDTDKILGSPAIFDINFDGIKEIIFCDYTGKVFITNPDGQLLHTFQTDDQIWGAPSIADLNNDGTYEIIISSKDQSLYILNHEAELITSYNANQYLLGTPAIGNIDLDDDLEIIFGGYSNQGKVFAINMDGTNVEGFPIQINEKIQRGVALADLNNNNKVDIIFGTDSEHIHVIYDDASIAFTVELDGDIRTAPSIIKMGNEYLILVGSRDDNFYAIDSSGEIKFTYSTGDKVESSPSILEYNNNIYIFFGSSDGYLYGIDTNGQDITGYPVFIDSAIESSPLLSDFNGDAIPEIVVSSVSNDLKIFNIDGTNYTSIPIIFEFPFSGQPIIDDVDLDGDLEIFVGTTNGMVGVDLKDVGGNAENYWHQYRNSTLRNGYIESNLILNNFNSEYPEGFILFPPYPNPFNSTTSISYYLKEPGKVQISVHDITGRKIRMVENEFYKAGYQSIDWNPSELSSGQYFINLTVNDITLTKPVTLIK